MCARLRPIPVFFILLLISIRFCIILSFSFSFYCPVEFGNISEAYQKLLLGDGDFQKYPQVLLRRLSESTKIVNRRTLPHFSRYSSNNRPPFDNGNVSGNYLGGMHSSPLLSQDQPQLDSRDIKVVDLDTWSVSSGLASVSKSKSEESQLRLFGLEEVDDGLLKKPKQFGDYPDFDEIEDMRIHGNLFYKIEKSSIEFQEYNYDFHGKKLKSNTNGEREIKKKENPKYDLAENSENSLKNKVTQQAISKNLGLKDGSLVNKERLAGSIKEKYVVCTQDFHGSSPGKKLRSPTFNQLTGPYHEPFCLDIYVSKGSVRACVVHRVTSKVVVVAHSISKDMKFNLGSAKSRVAAATVGKFLAQRALADDIHDVIYTPRKGDKLEGKLQLVLQSIIDNGVNVKVRLKQRNPSK
ncbi:50S ribosomal protein L18, partial [Bienertia sinuspersici]